MGKVRDFVLLFRSRHFFCVEKCLYVSLFPIMLVPYAQRACAGTGHLCARGNLTLILTLTTAPA